MTKIFVPNLNSYVEDRTEIQEKIEDILDVDICFSTGRKERINHKEMAKKVMEKIPETNYDEVSEVITRMKNRWRARHKAMKIALL